MGAQDGQEARVLEQERRMLLSGNEAVAHAALASGVALGVGYPGTPSTEILENFALLGGKAQWSPNEKVAMEVGLGVAYAGGRAVVTMKHVGLNVAADPLFTAAYTGVDGAFVVAVCDDPGMASSQNEQDSRRYAVAAGLPMLEPSDSQEAFDLFGDAIAISERWNIPVLLRMTTRICHSKTVVELHDLTSPNPVGKFRRDVQGRVMIPAFARPAHHRLRDKLQRITEWGEMCDLNPIIKGDASLGIISSGVAHPHAREAAPQASHLKIGLSYPLPLEKIREFAARVERCLVIEEGDPHLADSIRAAGIEIESAPSMFRFGELNVVRVRRILEGDQTPEAAPPKGKPPQLCVGCPHRNVFDILRDHNCIVSGDIGCYTLGVLPPFNAMDTCVCMGASIGVGLGMRHTLPDDEAKRVVSVIGDSTFMHSGITGLVEMVYNPPKTGHLVLILDNGTTAMTGLQEHPGTGRTLGHEPSNKVSMEDMARAIGIESVHVINPIADQRGLEQTIVDCLAAQKPAVIITRRPCLLAAGKIKAYEHAAEENTSCDGATCSG